MKDFQPAVHRHAHKLVKKLQAITRQEIDRHTGKIPKDTEITGQAPSDRDVALAHPENQAVVDVLFWLSRTTLDIIGEIGFDFDFQSLEHGNKDRLAGAMNTLMEAVLNVDMAVALYLILSEKPSMSWLRKICLLYTSPSPRD